MINHIIAFLIGFLLDMAFGDPHWLPHPIRLIGNLISVLEKRLLGAKGCIIEKSAKSQRMRGVSLVLVTLTATVVVSLFLLLFSYWLHPVAGIVVEAIMTYQILAAKCLKIESMKVHFALKKHDLSAARLAVSMIVGRDTDCLDEAGVAKAAVETVAENTSDGVIAPMLYTALGGPALGFFYKAVNTMDSMIGYKNDRYLYFGQMAAKLDDAVNFLPARISAWLMIAAAYLGGSSFNGNNARRIYKRDRKNHASPNSAQTESVCAGALGLQLAGDASYFGKLIKKPAIGDALRPIEHEDIRRANQLMYLTAWICEGACIVLFILILLVTA